MKQNKLLIICLFVVVIQSNVIGQNDVGFKVNVSASFIPNSQYSTSYPITYKKTYIAPSGQIGLFYNHIFNRSSVLGIDLLLNQVETRDKRNAPSWGENDFMEHKIHITYLSLPIYYEHRINKFSFNLGFQASVNLGASDEFIASLSDGSGDSAERNLTTLDKLDYGPKAGITYRLSTYLDLESTYYYGLNNIYNSSKLNIQNWRIRQFTLGIKYILTRPKKVI